MSARIYKAAVAILALITFIVVGAQIVNVTLAWECACAGPDCAWCSRETLCDCEHGLDVTTNCACWVCYEDEAFTEYEDEFTALFNSYETKWSKNGRLMMKRPSDKSFKFVSKGK